MAALGVDGIGRRCHAHIVAMPYPGRGHINPMMTLCKMLVSRSQSRSPPGDDQWGVAPGGILVTFVVTEEWYGFIGSHSKPTAVRFRCIPNIIPSEVGRAADFPGFIRAVYTKMEAPFEHLLDSLDLPPTLIIADTYLPWAVSLCNRRNIPLASLWTMSASMFSILYHFQLLSANGNYPDDPAVLCDEIGDGDERAVEYIPGISSIRIADLPTFFEGDGRKVLDLALGAVRMAPKAQYLIFTSACELEPKVIDAIRAELSIRVYTLGPVIPYLSKLSAAREEQQEDGRRKDDVVEEWLDSQPGGSVLYVSLGSFLSVSAAQKSEIGAGLRDSGVRYLWVTRSETPTAARSGERGLEVPWCDQLKVLCHDSVGGFWTHCGWNSSMEAAFAGVPMLACPIFWDQLPNSHIIVEEWKAGLRVKWKRAVGADNLVPREEIAQLVRRIMDSKSEDGREMKRRAAALSQICHRTVQKGGSSEANLTAFVEDIATPPSGDLPSADHH